MPHTITSLKGFVQKIEEVTPEPNEMLLYRGHSSRRFQLIPSVLRSKNYQDAEETMLRELVASHPADFSEDSTTLERLVRAQHYSLPTRLLDLTWNPLVALYFAAKECDDTGEVVILRIQKDKVKFYDSDTVSCLSNLAQLTITEKSTIDFALAETPFNEQRSIDRLLQFIRAEKPYFRPRIVPTDLQSVVAVRPKQNNPRILVQAGAFLVFGIRNALENTPEAAVQISRILINGRKKGDIIRGLDRVGINESTMYPEIERAADYIKKSRT